MQRYKLVLLCCVLVILSGCAGKHYTPQELQQYSSGQLLVIGELELAATNYARAAKYFEAIDALYPFSSEVQQGELNNIFAYYQAEDYPTALAAANRYIHLYPIGKHTDYAHYMKGIINFDIGHTRIHKLFALQAEHLDVTNWREAFLSFDQLIKEFPHSIYVPDAYQRMIYIRNALASHEINIARFYLEHQAYIAAANRASYVVQHFSNTSQIRTALQIMLASYEALGLNKQAHDVKRIMQLNNL